MLEKPGKEHQNYKRFLKKPKKSEFFSNLVSLTCPCGVRLAFLTVYIVLMK